MGPLGDGRAPVQTKRGVTKANASKLEANMLSETAAPIMKPQARKVKLRAAKVHIQVSVHDRVDHG